MPQTAFAGQFYALFIRPLLKSTPKRIYSRYRAVYLPAAVILNCFKRSLFAYFDFKLFG